jgi:peptide/nickel transport system substrate-binding protein
VVAQGADPTTLDPMNHQEAPATVLAINLFEWPARAGRGIRFHNGEPFDAESVKFSLERLIDPGLRLRGASAFTPLAHVEIVDPFTVRVHSRGHPSTPA